MILFADASALISIIARESDAVALVRIMETSGTRLCSAMSVWETVAGLCRSYHFSVDAARRRTDLFLSVSQIALVPIAVREAELAMDAYARFGKGRHPASLNMGDCFAYACTRANGARLLFKGDDFGLTDIELAYA